MLDGATLVEITPVPFLPMGTFTSVPKSLESINYFIDSREVKINHFD